MACHRLDDPETNQTPAALITITTRTSRKAPLEGQTGVTNTYMSTTRGADGVRQTSLTHICATIAPFPFFPNVFVGQTGHPKAHNIPGDPQKDLRGQLVSHGRKTGNPRHCSGANLGPNTAELEARWKGKGCGRKCLVLDWLLRVCGLCCGHGSAGDCCCVHCCWHLLLNSTELDWTNIVSECL